MSNLNRVLKRIQSKPSILQAAKDNIGGFVVTDTDRKNLTIMLRRNHVAIPKDASNNELLRLYLRNQYRYENQRWEMKQQAKKTALEKQKKADDIKVKKMLKILDEAQIKGLSEQPKHKRGYINLKG